LIDKIVNYFYDSVNSIISNKYLNKIKENKVKLKFIVIILFIIGVLRVVLEYFWLGMIGDTYDFTYTQVPVSIGIIFYGYFLFAIFPFFLDFFLRFFYDIHSFRKQLMKLYIASFYIWFMYPLVVLINIIIKSPVQVIDHKFFSFIPFYLKNSYFPWGMVIITLILYYKFSYVVKKIYKLTFFKSFLAVFSSFFLIYLLAYHWLLGVYRFFLLRPHGEIILLIIALMFMIFFYFMYLPKIFASKKG